jgi:hypothetical protein
LVWHPHFPLNLPAAGNPAILFEGKNDCRFMNHLETDRVSLELARRVAERLRWRPEILELARANLTRWKRQNASCPSLLRCYSEWERILSRPVSQICEILSSESDDAQRLRQNSPFAGVLSPAEVWEVKSRFRHATASA